MIDQTKPPLSELAHFGVKGMRWGVRREDVGSSPQGLVNPKQLIVTQGDGYLDVLPKKGVASHQAAQNHDDMVSAFTQLSAEYPHLKTLGVEIVPMSHVPGYEFMIEGGGPASAEPMPGGRIRLAYNDKQPNFTPEMVAHQRSFMPGTSEAGYTGRHELGHILAMSGGVFKTPSPDVHTDQKALDSYFNERTRQHKAVLAKHGLDFKTVSKLSRYAATSPEEALAELAGNYFTPTLRSKMDPVTRKKAKSLFDELGHKS